MLSPQSNRAKHSLYEQEQNAGNGAAATKPWLARAIGEGTFQLVYECLEACVKVRISLAEPGVCIAFLSYVLVFVGTDNATSLLLLQSRQLES